MASLSPKCQASSQEAERTGLGQERQAVDRRLTLRRYAFNTCLHRGSGYLFIGRYLGPPATRLYR
jgi:hypothetical protein